MVFTAIFSIVAANTVHATFFMGVSREIDLLMTEEGITDGEIPSNHEFVSCCATLQQTVSSSHTETATSVGKRQTDISDANSALKRTLLASRRLALRSAS